MDELIDAIADASPRFQEELLVNYPQREIENAPDFIDTAWSAAMQLVGNAFTYEGYEVLRPEERAKFEMSGKKNTRTISSTVSELSLIRCKFRHEGQLLENYFYVPYYKDRCLFIRGKRMAVILGINEQVFSRMEDENCDGVMIRPMRTPLRFNQSATYRPVSMTSDFRYYEWVTIGYLHNKPAFKRNNESTIILYLLAKFGFTAVLKRFGLSPKDFAFTNFIRHDEASEFEYFAASRMQKNSTQCIYLKVRKTQFNQPFVRKFVANVLYSLIQHEIADAEELYDPDATAFLVILGRTIKPGIPAMQARNNAETHIASVDSFLDPITKVRFNKFIPGIGDDMYDVLCYVFIHIESLMTNSTARNLYNKRVDVSVGILIEAYAKAIFSRMYKSNQKSELRRKEVTGLLKNRPMAINAAINTQKKDGARNINPSPTVSNDSWLSSCGIFKNRHDGSPKLRFHPSMGYVETLTAFTGKNIGRSGFINPMLVIDRNGGIVRQPYCEDLDSILEYLPK